MSSRAEGRGGNGEWIKAPSSPEAADSEGLEWPDGKDQAYLPGALPTSSPAKRTKVNFMSISRNKRLITELVGNSALHGQLRASGQ